MMYWKAHAPFCNTAVAIHCYVAALEFSPLLYSLTHLNCQIIIVILFLSASFSFLRIFNMLDKLTMSRDFFTLGFFTKQFLYYIGKLEVSYYSQLIPTTKPSILYRMYGLWYINTQRLQLQYPRRCLFHQQQIYRWF